MRFKAMLLVVIVVGLSARAYADDAEIASLISQLADPEPSARAEAFEKLRLLGTAAAPQLRIAAQSNDPAIADAANAMLMEGRWFRFTDPPMVRQMLLDYGKQIPERRADILASLLNSGQPGTRDVVIRVLMQDPSDVVAWRALDSVVPDGSWLTPFETIDIKVQPPGMQMFYGKVLYSVGQTDKAVALMQKVIAQDQLHPGATAQQLADPILETLVPIEEHHGHPTNAAKLLRLLLARAEDKTIRPEPVADALFALHLRYGPLPGAASDLSRSNTADDRDVTWTLAAMADSVQAPLVHDILLENALRERPGEATQEKIIHAFSAGEMLVRTPALGDAARAYSSVIDLAANGANALQDGVLSHAYLQLSEVYRLQGHFQEGGDAMQRGIDLKQPQVNLVRRGILWTHEDSQARVYWFYYKQAEKDHDNEGMRKYAQLMVSSGSTDGDTFLDIVPTLDALDTPESANAYFDRVYAQAKATLDRQPNDPTALNGLAWTCGRAGRRLPEAWTLIERALKLRPEEPAFLDTAAEIKFRLGEPAEALALEKRAAAQWPDDTFMQDQVIRFRTAAATQPAK